MDLELSPRVSRRVRQLLQSWGTLWGVDELPALTHVTCNPRLRRSLARCRPRVGKITLSTDLLRAGSMLDEVLCHEAAHVAAYRLTEGSCRRHGPEWALLMTVAGFLPRVRLPNITPAGAGHPERPRFDHICPVCQQHWVAARPMRRWRCPDCLDHGLPGELEVHATPAVTDV